MYISASVRRAAVAALVAWKNQPKFRQNKGVKEDELARNARLKKKNNNNRKSFHSKILKFIPVCPKLNFFTNFKHLELKVQNMRILAW